MKRILSFLHHEFGYMEVGSVVLAILITTGSRIFFFTGNQVSCRLYINKGDKKFEDITSAAASPLMCGRPG